MHPSNEALMKMPTVECLGIYLKLQTYLIAHRMIWMMSRSHLMLDLKKGLILKPHQDIMR
ncbi:hypothetical protein BSPWISOXPB_6755 [uncultured Gammaproteobacteria bacterium]|nr:hypothetical protein BSPWISOXPB_6755 [uncultured Gammaproteobacteria bacterium]